jgi:flavin-dependent dehydrogenase
LIVDVAVIGGGPAGCATVLALRQRGVRDVLLVDAGDNEAVRVGESIPPESRLLLERLDVWDEFLHEGHEPCLGSCSVWGDETPGYNDFLFNPHGTGWHLDRRRFDALLARKAVERGVVSWSGTRFDGIERSDVGFVVQTTNGAVAARFVVDATGVSARVARLLGATRRMHDGLTYVAGFLEASAEISRLTLLEATEHGWWYAARLPERKVAVGFASDPEIVRDEALHERDAWLARLHATRHLSRELAGCALVSADLVVRTALSSLLEPACGDGWLAVGDAAASYDPISSQGIYKALADGLQAAEAIVCGTPASDHAARFDEYLAVRNYFYERERRWPSAPFWLRRRARVTLPA